MDTTDTPHAKWHPPPDPFVLEQQIQEVEPPPSYYRDYETHAKQEDLDSHGGDLHTNRTLAWDILEVVEVKERARAIAKQDFHREFCKWLIGNSKYNVETIRGRGQNDITLTPWGDYPLTDLSMVAPYLDGYVDAKTDYSKKRRHLRLRGPRNLKDALNYFKHIVVPLKMPRKPYDEALLINDYLDDWQPLHYGPDAAMNPIDHKQYPSDVERSAVGAYGARAFVDSKDTPGIATYVRDVAPVSKAVDDRLRERGYDHNETEGNKLQAILDQFVTATSGNKQAGAKENIRPSNISYAAVSASQEHTSASDDATTPDNATTPDEPTFDEQLEILDQQMRKAMNEITQWPALLSKIAQVYYSITRDVPEDTKEVVMEKFMAAVRDRVGEFETSELIKRYKEHVSIPEDKRLDADNIALTIIEDAMDMRGETLPLDEQSLEEKVAEIDLNDSPFVWKDKIMNLLKGANDEQRGMIIRGIQTALGNLSNEQLSALHGQLSATGFRSDFDNNMLAEIQNVARGRGLLETSTPDEQPMDEIEEQEEPGAMDVDEAQERYDEVTYVLKEMGKVPPGFRDPNWVQMVNDTEREKAQLEMDYDLGEPEVEEIQPIPVTPDPPVSTPAPIPLPAPHPSPKPEKRPGGYKAKDGESERERAIVSREESRKQKRAASVERRRQEASQELVPVPRSPSRSPAPEHRRGTYKGRDSSTRHTPKQKAKKQKMTDTDVKREIERRRARSKDPNARLALTAPPQPIATPPPSGMLTLPAPPVSAPPTVTTESPPAVTPPPPEFVQTATEPDEDPMKSSIAPENITLAIAKDVIKDMADVEDMIEQTSRDKSGFKTVKEYRDFEKMKGRIMRNARVHLGKITQFAEGLAESREANTLNPEMEKRVEPLLSQYISKFAAHRGLVHALLDAQRDPENNLQDLIDMYEEVKKKKS